MVSSSFLSCLRVRRLKRVRVWKMARFVEPETLLADQGGGGGRGRKEDGCRAHGTDQSAPPHTKFFSSFAHSLLM